MRGMPRARARKAPARPIAFLLFIACFLGCSSPGIRRFPDRPPAWDEHDTEHVPRPPARDSVLRFTAALRSLTVGSVDFRLSLPTILPAADVNSRDEVPCSTWFCPKNHLRPMSPEAVAAGPAADPPVLPLTVRAGKSSGAQPGFEATDARGRRYLVKFDPPGRVGMATAAEAVASRLFHAAGYYVPGTSVIELAETDLVLAPDARYRAHGFEEKPLTPALLHELLSGVGRSRAGRLRAVAVEWLEGDILGNFGFAGRRKDDPNDRIPHENRRSLRATRLLYAWLDVADAGPSNTLDVYVKENGRRFVRHYIIDFGAALGSSTTEVKHPPEAREHKLALGRMAAALFSLGMWERKWQRERAAWDRAVHGHPSLGWYPAEGWEPDDYQTSGLVAAHAYLRPEDAYWGAKVITSFTDDQLRAAVAAGRLPEPDARALLSTLKRRRDAIGRAYLLGVTALEDPEVTRDATMLCFRDLAVERGFAAPSHVVYEVEVADDHGQRFGSGRFRAAGARSCVPLGSLGAPAPDGVVPYWVVRVRARVQGRPTVPALVHLRHRDGERRFVVVGWERRT